MARRKRNEKARLKWRKICATRNSHLNGIMQLPEHIPCWFLPRNLKYTRSEPHIPYMPRNPLHTFYKDADYERLRKFFHKAIQKPSEWKTPEQRALIEQFSVQQFNRRQVLSVGKPEAEEMLVHVGEDVFRDYPAEKAVRSDLQDTFFRDQPTEFQFVEDMRVTFKNEPRKRHTKRKVKIRKNSNIEIAILVRPYFVLG